MEKLIAHVESKYEIKKTVKETSEISIDVEELVDYTKWQLAFHLSRPSIHSNEDLWEALQEDVEGYISSCFSDSITDELVDSELCIESDWCLNIDEIMDYLKSRLKINY